MTLSPRLRRALVSLLAGSLATTGALAAGGSVSAEPRPTLREVQRQVDALNHQAEQATERYNTARVELGETNRRLRAVRHRLDRQRATFSELQAVIGRLAATTYMSGSIDAAVALLLSDDPRSFLRQAGDLEQLGRHQSAMLRRMGTARLRLLQDRAEVREQQRRAAALEASLEDERREVVAKLAEANQLLETLEAEELARLEAQRRAAVDRATEARSGAMRASRDSRPGTFPTSDGPATGSAATAVRAAFAQLGDPYAWGAAGPGSFDCSGLTMYAWAAAGVSLPHSSSAQYSAVRHISLSDLQPGDLVFYYSPISHVAMYIGGGRVIDAPYPGRSVHITGLHSMPVVGAGRP